MLERGPTQFILRPSQTLDTTTPLQGNKQWTAKRVQSRPEIKLTPGKGVQDLTCSVTDLVDQVIRSTKVSYTI